MSRDDVIRRTAVAIRLACPDNLGQNLSDDEYFARPIHASMVQDGTIKSIHADAEKLAEWIVDLHRQGFFEDYK